MTLKDNEEYQLSTANDIYVVEPLEGRAKVGPVKLDFCDRIPQTQERTCPVRERSEAKSISQAIRGAEHSGLDTGRIGRILAGACNFPNDPGFEEAVGSVVQLWVNWFGQSREDAIESLVLRGASEKWKNDLDAGCRKIQVDEEASPEDASITRARREAVGCRAGGNIDDLDWYIDKGDQPPSELVRLGYAMRCLQPDNLDPSNKREWWKVGVCARDIRELDAKKVAAETAKMTAPQQAHARENVSYMKSALADLERVVKPKADSDPDYKHILYDAPEAGWDAWVALYRKHKKAMDATYAFEKAMFGPRIDAYQGCYKALEPGVVAFFKGGKFKTKEQVEKALREPIGYTLLNALGACYAITAPASAGVAMMNGTKESRVWRGPRAAAGYAMVEALNDIKENRPRFPLQAEWFYPDLTDLIVKEARYGERTKVPNNGNFPDTVEGVVKTSKKYAQRKETLRLDFKTEMWMEKVVTCRDTKKIDRIENGKVYYRKTCQSQGMQQRKFTPKATAVPDWAGKGIRPNALIKLQVPSGSEYSNQLRFGYPLEVYANKSKKKLVSVYGFLL
jgi:hypothetical protein